MTTLATISVITPCYNGSAYVRATIESALNQTHRPLEVIVVDDGSTDDSAAIAESFGPPVTVIRQKNQGESVARNVGIKQAKGEYLFFLDADDLVHPEAFARLLAVASEHRDGVANMGRADFTDDPQQPFRTIVPEAQEFFPAIIGGNFGPPHTWMAPKEIVLKAGGFRTDLQLFEDWDLWCRVALAGAKLATTPFVGAYYRHHSKSQMSTEPPIRKARGHAVLMQDLCLGMLKQPDLLSQHGEKLFWAAWTSLHRARNAGASWEELRGLRSAIQAVIQNGPPAVRSIRYARLMRVFGIPLAETVRNLFVGRGKVDALNDNAPRPEQTACGKSPSNVCSTTG